MLRFALLIAMAFSMPFGAANAQSNDKLKLPKLNNPSDLDASDRPQFEVDEQPSLSDQAKPTPDDSEGLLPEKTLRRDADDEDELETQEGEIEAIAPAKRQTLAQWPQRSIRDINISLAEDSRVPQDRSDSLASFGRGSISIGATYKTFAWQAPDIKYQPLYFEDVALERYGQTLPAYRQTLRSAWHMTKSFTGLGFQMLETPPRSCDYPLGFCRPGNCVPQTTQRHFFGSLSHNSRN